MKLNSNRLSNKCIRWAILGVAVFVICALMWVTIGWWTSSEQDTVHLADNWTRKTYNTYVDGTFSEATNALTTYIQFLEAHQEKLSKYRDMDAVLGTAHWHLAYMLLFCNEEMKACDHFRAAYEHYKRARARDGLDAVPRSEFVEYVIMGREKTDARHGAAWKSDHAFTLNSNTVFKVKGIFAGDQ